MAHAKSTARGRAPLGPRDGQQWMLDYWIQETGKVSHFQSVWSSPASGRNRCSTSCRHDVHAAATTHQFHASALDVSQGGSLAGGCGQVVDTHLVFHCYSRWHRIYRRQRESLVVPKSATTQMRAHDLQRHKPLARLRSPVNEVECSHLLRGLHIDQR